MNPPDPRNIQFLEALLFEHLVKIGTHRTAGETAHMLAEWLAVNGVRRAP